MHLTASDGTLERASDGSSTVVSYPTGDGAQDVSSLERFRLHTLAAGASTGTVVDAERESIWLVRSGSGSVTRGGSDSGASITVDIHVKDLLLFPPGQPHEVQASADGPLEFIDVAFEADAQRLGASLLAQPEGIGPAHGEGGTWGEELDGVRIGTRETGVLIKGTEMPPQLENSCFRYPHSRPHSTLDHMDQNSTLPGARAADHSHAENEEFWLILEGEGAPLKHYFQIPHEKDNSCQDRLGTNEQSQKAVEKRAVSFRFDRVGR